jgi:hypothetical protein
MWRLKLCHLIEKYCTREWDQGQGICFSHHCCFLPLHIVTILVFQLILLHSTSLCVCVCVFFFFFQRGASHVCVARLWSRCCLSISGIWDISSPQEWRSSWCYIYWWCVIQSEFHFGHTIVNISSNCYIGIAMCRNLTLSERVFIYRILTCRERDATCKTVLKYYCMYCVCVHLRGVWLNVVTDTDLMALKKKMYWECIWFAFMFRNRFLKFLVLWGW